MLLRLFPFILLLACFASPLQAQDREVPYWATIRDSAIELNMRVGPSADYKIDWVYRRPGLPVKVVRMMEGWRLIEDPDGTRGWVVHRLLSLERGALVTGKGETAIYTEPNGNSQVKWRLEPGVVGQLGDCEEGWCEFAVGPRAGFVPQNRLWGAGEP